MYHTDCLIIGSGIAGLSYALYTARKNPNIKITILTKNKAFESNTKYAQGGIAAVQNLQIDSFEQHMEDTIIAGAGLCDTKVVKMVIEQAPKRLQELINWGVQFDENRKGTFDLGKEGGHSQHRILHHKDITGFEIARALLLETQKIKNITILEEHFTIDLITEHQTKNKIFKNRTCFGAYVFDIKNKKIKTFCAKITMIATGGAGQVYQNTTNPTIATGDGIGIAYRAKALIRDMEFVQFHPTALYQNPQESPAFLISEAVRGLGAYLKDEKGKRFMKNFDARMELAPRDIVARAIDNVLKKQGRSYVYLDCTHLDMQKFKSTFPNILKKCESINIDVEKDYIPITPAAHYFCGGIVVDTFGRTNVRNLYACGECSRTGLHGGNRLASNSLLEAIVYGYKSSLDTLENIHTIPLNTELPQWDSSNTSKNKEAILVTHAKKEVQNIMSEYVGIVRSNLRLQNAEKRLYILYQEIEALFKKSTLSVPICELRNLITTAHLICECSAKRKKNLGGFFNKDLV